MVTRYVWRCGLAVVAVLLALGLWLRLGPAPVAAAPPAQTDCTISWTNTSGGDWNRVDNWDAGRVPGDDDVVCITRPGPYQVNLTGSASMSGLIIGASGSSPTLRLQNPLYINITLTVNGNLVNYGSLVIPLPCDPNCRTNQITVNGGILTNIGTIEILKLGNDGSAQINADLMNQGLLRVNGPLAGRGVFTNAGQLFIGAGQQFSMTGAEQVFNQNAGTITNNGTFTLTEGTFHLNGGEIVPNPAANTEPILRDALLQISSGQGKGRLVVMGPNTRLQGNVYAGQTILVSNPKLIDTTVTIQGSLTNEGRILLEPPCDPNCRTIKFALQAGLFINKGTVALQPTGGWWVIDTDLRNEGILTIAGKTTFDRQGGIYTNAGTMEIAVGQTVTLTGKSQSFIQASGSLVLGGDFTINNAALSFLGGRLEGKPLVLRDSAAALGPESGRGELVFIGNNSKLSGRVGADQKVVLRALADQTTTTLTAEADLHNLGTIRMEHVNCCQLPRTRLALSEGTFVNEEGGIVEIAPGNPGSIDADIVNEGLISVSGSLALVKPAGTYTNKGTLTINPGQTLTIANGALSNPGGRIVGPSGTITINAGATLAGTGTLVTTVVNNGTVAPGGAGGAGQLRINGNYSQGRSARLEIDLGGATPGSGYDQLVVDGNAGLAGTLAVAQAYSFVPAQDDTFDAVTFATRSGGNMALTAPTGWGLAQSYDAVGKLLRLTVTAAAGEPSRPWLVMLYLAGDDLDPGAGRPGLGGLTRPLDELITRLNRPSSYNPNVHLVVLYDGDNEGDSRVYVREQDELKIVGGPGLPPLWLGYPSRSNELDSGSVATLQSFVDWARKTYGARYSMLSIVDHGGGWAPDLDLPGQPRGNGGVQAGGWRGMSLDVQAGGSSLSTRDTGEALGGLGRIDVLFFDACLMGMIESAYEVRDVADYYIAGQNLLFAALPYQDYLSPGRLNAQTTPQAMAESIVERYNFGDSSSRFPYTISALDLRRLRADVPNNLAVRINTLAERLLAWVPAQPTADDAAVQTLKAVYGDSQKFDYDNDMVIRQDREGYVDLVDFAQRLSEVPQLPPGVRNAALDIVSAANQSTNQVVINHRVAPGSYNGNQWDFVGANGLSIFLPLGERDYRPTGPVAGNPNTAQPERQLTYYADPSQLSFTRDTPKWSEFLERMEPTVPVFRTGPGGLPAAVAELPAAYEVDTRRFFTPYQLPASSAGSPEQHKVYLPLIRR